MAARCAPILLSFLLLVGPAVQAHALRGQDVHVHGQASVEVALDRGVLELSLRAPGIGVLDFERPPLTTAEQAALRVAQSQLQRGHWVTLPAAAQCRLIESSASAEGYAAAAAAATAPAPRRHAGFTALLRFRCANPPALRALVLPLPTLFPGLHEVIVSTVTDSGQGRSVVTADQPRVVLAP